MQQMYILMWTDCFLYLINWLIISTIQMQFVKIFENLSTENVMLCCFSYQNWIAQGLHLNQIIWRNMELTSIMEYKQS